MPLPSFAQALLENFETACMCRLSHMRQANSQSVCVIGRRPQLCCFEIDEGQEPAGQYFVCQC